MTMPPARPNAASDTTNFIAARDGLQQLLGYAASALDGAGTEDRDLWQTRCDDWTRQLRELDQTDAAQCRRVLEATSQTLRTLRGSWS